ncbi:MAG: hypothetical protein ABW172_00640 [Candidatus Binatia bacterium]
MVYQAKVPLTVLAALLLVLVLVGILLSLGNQSLRVEVSDRQQFIAQSMQLEGLHREIITTLVTAALKTNDEKLKGLLASQGISFGAESGPVAKPK